MLARASFQNFKALKAVDVDLSPFTVIVGKNGAGKTSVLQGILDVSEIAVRRALDTIEQRLLVIFGGDPPEVLIVAHDTDGDRARIKDLEQALSLTHPMPVVIAAPHQDAEAWFVAGFRPESDVERRQLAERRDELGFDPPEEPHRLTAHPNDARTDAKRVLCILVSGEDASRPPALEELPDLCDRTLNDLGLLERRGAECGLAAFLGALRSTLVPCFIPGPAGRG